MQIIRTGGCSCGTVRYEARGTPRFVSNCHCQACRRATGAAYSTWVGFETVDVSWAGDRRLHASSPDVQRGFCAICGSPLSYSGRRWASETHLLIGTFDSDAGLVPTGDTFPEEKLSWVSLPTVRARR